MMEIKGRLFWIAWLSVTWLAAAETGWMPSGSVGNIFPNPNVDPAKCGRDDVARSSVCDPDSVLSFDTRVALDGLINQIQGGEGNFAKPLCGASLEGFQIGVAVMNKISPDYIGDYDGDHDDYEDDVADAAVRFAEELHDSWGIGDAACNNGVLLLISVEDRYMYISTGKGAKGRLTERRIANVVSVARQLFRRGKFDQGTEVAVQMMGDYLAQELSTGEKIWSGVTAIFDLFWWVLGFLVMAMSVVLCCCSLRYTIRRNIRKKDLRGKLKRLQDERDQARDRPYFESSSCPICLEEWASTPPNDEGQAKRILPCGHAFHAKCIEDWLRTAPKSECPICKRDVFGDNDAGSSTRRSTGPEPCQQQATTEADHAFRLGRLHHMYPDFVTDQLFFNWRAQPNADYLQELDAEIAVQEAQAEHAARVNEGRSGSSFSFGGGSSHGGGGGGGHW